MTNTAAESTKPAPLISIITATYNWSTVLRFAIQSVLWQTWPNFEMLIIGDGCTDDSEEVVQSFQDARLRWHNLPENSGHQSVPNNTGLAMARGKYVAYLGHDDLWYPIHLATLVNELEKTNAEVANSLCLMIGPPGTGVRHLAGMNWVPPSCMMHKRSLVNEIGHWKKYTEIHDSPEADFLHRAELNGSKVVKAKKITVFKFPSAWRRYSYRERRFDEQGEYARRIQTEPDFLEQEIIDTALAYEQGKTWIEVLPKKPRFTPPGWHIEQYRRLRGVDARPLAPLTALQRVLLFLYPLTLPIRKLRHAFTRFARHRS
jgi:glycosyltransferase involved in cell wall biosynthesis